MGTGAAQRPAGRISEVFADSAERQGAYDFVETEHVRVEELCAAMGAAAARRVSALGGREVIVPVDSTSLSLLEKVDDPKRDKDFGPVGAVSLGVRGLHVMTALALTSEGVPLGVSAIEWWVRPAKALSLSRPQRDGGPLEETELRYAARAFEATRARLREAGVDAQPWFQFDRGGDVWSCFGSFAMGSSSSRCACRTDRNVGDYDGRIRRSHQRAKRSLRQASIRFEMRVRLPKQPKRRGRTLGSLSALGLSPSG
jgi:hypothetical protein